MQIEGRACWLRSLKKYFQPLAHLIVTTASGGRKVSNSFSVYLIIKWVLRGEITRPESHGWQISEPGPLGKKGRGCTQSGSIPSSLDILCDFSVSAMILIYRQGTRLRGRGVVPRDLS